MCMHMYSGGRRVDSARLLSLQARRWTLRTGQCQCTLHLFLPTHRCRSARQCSLPACPPPSLQSLDLTANLIEDDALPLLARLPCLGALWLHDNPLARRDGYWARCAAAFAAAFAEARGGAGVGVGGGGGGGGERFQRTTRADDLGTAAAQAPMEKVFVDGVLITHPALALT